MYKKSAISVFLAVVMLVSCLIVPTASAAALEDGSAAAPVVRKRPSLAADNTDAYKLASNVQDGNILHAFNWHFNDVERYMKDIADAGFTSVQVSPVQGSKPTINVASYACDWWALYQPINFEIGNVLGTKADFEEMCSTAKKYGVKIIVDIVANHMAQSDGGGDGKRHPAIINDLRLDPNAWHTVNGAVSDANRYSMTQKRLSGLPDLNTSNEKVQNYVKGLLEECLDAGADGFRFDAAKHIELPTDEAYNGTEYASDFWPNVTSYARSIKPDVYIYGEVLSPYSTDTKNYTKYINMTDSAYGNRVRSTIKGTSAGNIGTYSVTTASPDQLVTWIESHDNYISNGSNTLTDEQLLLGWGIIGARKDATALYLVRPEHGTLGVSNGAQTIAYDELMGGPGDLLWQDKAVAEINKFRNAFEGQDETVSSDGGQFYVQRGTSGMVIVNLAGSAANINAAVTMKDGTYTDQVSGTSFTVSGGKLTGTVAAKKVAVIYNKSFQTPTASIKLDGKAIDGDSAIHFAGDTAKVQLALNNAQSGTYSVDGAAPVSFTNTTEVTIGTGVAFNKEIPVTITATNTAGTTTETYKIVKKDPKAKIVAYFDATGNESWVGDSGIWCYVKDENGKEIAEYPGIKMEQVKGTSYYKAEIEGLTKATVKFNEGPVSTGLDGRTIPPTVLDYGVATEPENREAGGFEIIGMMEWADGAWRDRLAAVEEDPYACEPYALGDADGNGKLNVTDCITIQKSIAKILSLTEDGIKAADIDASGEVTVQDVIWLQKYFAKMPVPYKIGLPVTDPEEPTEYTVYFYNYKDWKEVYAYSWENMGGTPGAWPGQPMEKVNANDNKLYKITLPIAQNAIIFNNNDDIDGKDQTEEVVVEPENYGKMFSGMKNEDGSYGKWTDVGDYPPIVDTTAKVYFENTTKWKKVSAYMYMSGSGKENHAWPGVRMTLEGTNAAGNQVYSVEYEDGAFNNVIFTDGSRQSNDLALEEPNMLYTPITTTGKFDCTTKPYTGLN